MNKTFEQYLMGRFMFDEPQTLDDDIPDAYEAWLSERDVSEIMIHADGWMNETKSHIATAVRKLLK